MARSTKTASKDQPTPTQNMPGQWTDQANKIADEMEEYANRLLTTVKILRGKSS